MKNTPGRERQGEGKEEKGSVFFGFHQELAFFKVGNEKRWFFWVYYDPSLSSFGSLLRTLVTLRLPVSLSASAIHPQPVTQCPVSSHSGRTVSGC